MDEAAFVWDYDSVDATVQTDSVTHSVEPRSRTLTAKVPPHAFFLASAVFHYLGPSFAVLLFSRMGVLGVAWLRIASAAAVFSLWRLPWRHFRRLSPADQATTVSLGVVLAAMNTIFYAAISRLPLSTVGAIEFLGPIGLAVAGTRTTRNFVALGLASTGVFILTDVRIAGEFLGYVFAFANCALFVLYVVLGHRIATEGANAIDRLGTAMLVATIVAFPIGIRQAVPALFSPPLLGAAIGVGVSSSVIPYVCDQLAMARLPRPSFALMLSLLPATATVVGMIVLHQIPAASELGGIALVVAGVAFHNAGTGAQHTIVRSNTG
jgi:inner membrane transporter RhtA